MIKVAFSHGGNLEGVIGVGRVGTSILITGNSGKYVSAIL